MTHPPVLRHSRPVLHSTYRSTQGPRNRPRLSPKYQRNGVPISSLLVPIPMISSFLVPIPMISSFLVPTHGPGLIHSKLNKSYSHLNDPAPTPSAPTRETNPIGRSRCINRTPRRPPSVHPSRPQDFSDVENLALALTNHFRRPYGFYVHPLFSHYTTLASIQPQPYLRLILRQPRQSSTLRPPRSELSAKPARPHPWARRRHQASSPGTTHRADNPKAPCKEAGPSTSREEYINQATRPVDHTTNAQRSKPGTRSARDYI